MTHRMDQVNELIRRELGNVLKSEVDFPLGSLVTIDHVITSKDLKHAKIFLTILPVEKEQEVFQFLKKNIRDIQYELHQNIKLRVSPKIFFVIDEAQKKARHIESLLDSVSAEENNPSK